MTEQDWLGCADPTLMLVFLNKNPSQRKFRLFACQCVQDAWMTPHGIPLRAAIETAEMMAEGQATGPQIAEASTAMELALMGASNAPCYIIMAAAATLRDCAIEAASLALDNMISYNLELLNDSGESRTARLLREIFGNPVRPVSVDPVWRSPTAISFATAIYEDRAFDRLPILADALEDAGCTNADLLNHCRQPGDHVRGCWALDLILARE